MYKYMVMWRVRQAALSFDQHSAADILKLVTGQRGSALATIAKNNSALMPSDRKSLSVRMRRQ